MGVLHLSLHEFVFPVLTAYLQVKRICNPGGEVSHQGLYARCSPGGEFSHRDLYAVSRHETRTRRVYLLKDIDTPCIVTRAKTY